MSDVGEAATQKGFLGWVERTGNKLPDPVFIFFYLIIALIAFSVLADLLNFSAQHPTATNPDGTPKIEEAKSLLAQDNVKKLWTDMPATFTHFHPLGYVLVVMLGAGVAERSGLFASAIRGAMSNAPKFLLTPLVALVAMLSNHAADAGYVVMIPLAAIIFASAGRHPLAGIAAGFAGVSGGFSANLTPGQLDALLFGITEASYGAGGFVEGYEWTVNFAANWYFIVGLLFIYLPVIWYVTDRIIEPRLGKWQPDAGADMASYANENAPLTPEQKKGLGRAGLAILAVAALWVLMTVIPDAPLWYTLEEIKKNCVGSETGKAATRVAQGFIETIDRAAIDAKCALVTERAEWYNQAEPLFKSLVAAFLILFLAAGWAYGAAAKTINNHKDLVAMMSEGMKDMAYYLVLAFAAAHFVAMFNWSNLGIITAVHGADGIKSLQLPLAASVGLLVLFSALLNLFVGSASAKWALLAPVLVPMFMILGATPDGATAAYRVGDGATNIITPLMVYFPLILVFAQRWKKDFGLGSLTAMMIPYSIWMLITGVAMMIAWIYLGIPLGPGAPVEIPAALTGS